MPDLGKKYTCYSCHTKFYDLGKPVPLCPKCGADQREADEAPVVTTSRGRGRVAAAAAPPPVIEEPADDDFGGDSEAAGNGEDEDEEVVPETREEEAEEDEEDEEY